MVAVIFESQLPGKYNLPRPESLARSLSQSSEEFKPTKPSHTLLPGPMPAGPPAPVSAAAAVSLDLFSSQL